MRPLEIAQQKQFGGGKRGELDTNGGVIVLPIFMGPVFAPEDHRVRNWAFGPEHRPGEFPGEDIYGWGFHSNGMVDCINLPLCRSFSLSMAQNWATLWKEESFQAEWDAKDKQPARAHEMLLRRLITRVRLDLGYVQFIPDPEVFNVMVHNPNAMSVRDTAIGSPVFKRQPTPKIEQYRNALFKPRGSWPDFTNGKQPWQNR